MVAPCCCFTPSPCSPFLMAHPESSFVPDSNSFYSPGDIINPSLCSCPDPHNGNNADIHNGINAEIHNGNNGSVSRGNDASISLGNSASDNVYSVNENINNSHLTLSVGQKQTILDHILTTNPKLTCLRQLACQHDGMFMRSENKMLNKSQLITNFTSHHCVDKCKVSHEDAIVAGFITNSSSSSTLLDTQPLSLDSASTVSSQQPACFIDLNPSHKTSVLGHRLSQPITYVELHSLA
jgi:hypothetical protein